MAFAFQHSFDMPIIITRTMNCIGERQNVEKFVPKTIRAILGGQKVVIHGSSAENTSSRCWLHARNAADAILYLLNQEESEDMYHVVGEERSVLDVADIICQEIRGRNLGRDEVTFVDYHSARPGHDIRYAMDGSKILKFGWKPKVPFEQSLRKVVRWSLEENNRKWLEI